MPGHGVGVVPFLPLLLLAIVAFWTSLFVAVDVDAAAFCCCWSSSSSSVCKNDRYLPHSTTTAARARALSSSVEVDALQLLPLETAAAELERRVRASSTDHVQVEGYVTAKRGFGPSFCFLDLSQKGQDVPVQAMLKRQDFEDDDRRPERRFDGIMKCAVLGARIRVKGPAIPARNTGEALVGIRAVDLVGLPRNPQRARIWLLAASEGLVDATQVACAAGLSLEKLQTALQRAEDGEDEADDDDDDGHSRLMRFQALAKQILAGLPEDASYPNGMLLGEGGDETADDSLLLPLAPPEIQHAPKVAVERLTAASGILESACSSVKDIHHNETLIAGGGRGRRVSVAGWVQNRRRFRGSLAVLEVVDQMVRANRVEPPSGSGGDSSTTTTQQSPRQRIKCVLHPQMIMSRETPGNTTKVLGTLLAPGSHVALEGWLEEGPDDAQGLTKGLVLWITSTRLLRASWRPTVIRYLLDLVAGREFDAAEAAQAMRLSDHEIDAMGSSVTERQWKAMEISRSLQDAETRMGTVTPQMLAAVREASLMARDRYPIEAVQAQQTMVEPGMMAASRWKRKKEPQLGWMARQVELVVRTHPAFGSRRLKILDVGGGQGFLANHLAEHFRKDDSVEIQVVDIAPGAIHNGAARSSRRRLSGVTYTVGDASTKTFGGDVDVVVALHACGALTDVALGQAAANGAGFVICPCCFRSNPHLLVPTAERPSISVEEWLGVESETYDLLRRIAEVQGDLSLAGEAIHSICALRANAFHRRSTQPLNIAVKTFPIAFSTRNFCLVGTYDDVEAQ